jgi:hypothetical protein
MMLVPEARGRLMSFVVRLLVVWLGADGFVVEVEVEVVVCRFPARMWPGWEFASRSRFSFGSCGCGAALDLRLVL